LESGGTSQQCGGKLAQHCASPSGRSPDALSGSVGEAFRLAQLSGSSTRASHGDVPFATQWHHPSGNRLAPGFGLCATGCLGSHLSRSFEPCLSFKSHEGGNSACIQARAYRIADHPFKSGAIFPTDARAASISAASACPGSKRRADGDRTGDARGARCLH